MIGRSYSFRYAFYCFIWWISFYLRLNTINRKYSQKKQTWLDNYIIQKYSNIVEKYRNAQESTVEVSTYKIWVFWGQGIEQMPSLVKRCYEQILSLNPSHSVVFLDIDSVGQYVHLPDNVFEKLKRGKLLFAHFSDILRNSLLSQYGGIWLDVTCWTAHPIPTLAYDSVFFSPHNKEEGTLWCTYAMGSNRIGSVTFSFVRDMLVAACEKEEVWPDYLFQDRVLDFAYRNIAASKIAIESLPDNSIKRYLLYPMMNKPFDKKFYKELIATEWLFKLSYKSFYQEYSNGKKTFWSSILNGTINEI